MKSFATSSFLDGIQRMISMAIVSGDHFPANGEKLVHIFLILVKYRGKPKTSLATGLACPRHLLVKNSVTSRTIAEGFYKQTTAELLMWRTE
ncbi:hypothetical protein NPIL_615201 [Nephila pilipes]|uniref:Uncharacterized protein n=1 Tax=Nephila pilipes TaxID=299642 RepID=A0A8X6QAH4_NEPPI|nr:hypothetical protein NPIL_615201 [Nephila pilipes]